MAWVACDWAGIATGSATEALGLGDEYVRLPGVRYRPTVSHSPLPTSSVKDEQPCSVHSEHGLCLLSFVGEFCLVDSFYSHFTGLTFESLALSHWH